VVRRRQQVAVVLVLAAATTLWLLTRAETETPPAEPVSWGEVSRVASGAPVTITFGGDVHFEGASAQALSRGLGPMTDILSRADLAMVNLETAVTTTGSPASKQFTFRAPSSAFSTLKASGVDVATMANNHGMDYGLAGLRDSLAASARAAFPVVGIGLDSERAFAAYRTQIKGQRIAVLGATQVLDSHLATAWTAGPGRPGLASAKDERRLLQAVRQARSDSDTVVVFLHWGQERKTCPLQRQRDLAQRLVDAGADVIVGSHAHVLLGGGYLSGAYVSYGLGNFVFYANGGPGTQSGALTVTTRGRAVTDAVWTPAKISAGLPAPLRGVAEGKATAQWQQLRGCTALTASP